jgi:hypothetical protein
MPTMRIPKNSETWQGVETPHAGTVNLTVGVSRYGRIAGCAIRQLACPATDFR